MGGNNNMSAKRGGVQSRRNQSKGIIKSEFASKVMG